jgi:hypothetical protein
MVDGVESCLGSEDRSVHANEDIEALAALLASGDAVAGEHLAHHSLDAFGVVVDLGHVSRTELEADFPQLSRQTLDDAQIQARLAKPPGRPRQRLTLLRGSRASRQRRLDP